MTNNKQQTAVDWFWNQLPEILPFTVDTETAVKLEEAYNIAKEVEKTALELPSDEELRKEFDVDEFDPYDLAYLGGAIWMRDKIQGGNK